MDSLTAAEPCSVFNQSHDFCDVHPSNQKKNLVCPRGYRPSFSFALNVAIPLSPLLNSQQKQSDSQAKLSLLRYVDLIYSNRAFLPDTINCL